MADSKNQKFLSDTNEESWISRYSISVGRVAGVPVYLNFSSAFIFILIAWTLSSTILPNNYPGLVQSTYIIIGLVCALTLLLSILLHEVAHSVIAARYGIKFQKITLFAFGGIALIPDEITVPKKEIWMAFVGPLMSFIISGLSFLLWFTFTQYHIFILHIFPIDAIFFYITAINFVIGFFNLLPIFPCDGGRILRSILSYCIHDHITATLSTIRIGMIVSICLLITGGVIGFKFTFIGGIWLMLVAYFLMRGSKMYYEHYQYLLSRN